jgi:hypothetical protein
MVSFSLVAHFQFCNTHDKPLFMQVAEAAQSRLFGLSGGLPEKEYRVSSISLWHTPPDSKPSLEKWEKVADFPLS